MSKSWWMLLLGFVVGALAPSLVAWGAMSADIRNNKSAINERLRISTFNEYKEGNNKILAEIQNSLRRIEKKLDDRCK